jgi:hypothetical protein
MSIFLFVLAAIGAHFLITVPFCRLGDAIKARAAKPNSDEEEWEAARRGIGVRWVFWTFGVTVLGFIVMFLCTPSEPLSPWWGLGAGVVVALPVLWIVCLIRVAIHFFRWLLR